MLGCRLFHPQCTGEKEMITAGHFSVDKCMRSGFVACRRRVIRGAVGRPGRSNRAQASQTFCL